MSRICGFKDEHLRERDALAHPPESCGGSAVESAEANALQPCVASFESLLPPRTAKFQAGNDIFNGYWPRHERLGLEHVPACVLIPPSEKSEHGYVPVEG